ncbi:peptidase [Gluconobacter potus]|uniref:Peptidase n=1 Tax=Gluconobacter potus TaxID=2724927 RepID=A0A149QSG3_9PROT|nr:S24 family peptidase [Gluconobacter potus]KXV00255.1 peptidase [Gluconobacter potus]
MASETDTSDDPVEFRSYRNDQELSERTERLKTAVRQAGGNTQVSIRSHVPLNTLNRYIAGREMKVSALVALAKACGVSVEWLAKGVEVAPSEEAAEVQTSATIAAPTGEDDVMPVKFFEVEPSAGLGVYPSEWVDAQDFHVSKKFIRQVLGVWSSCIFFVRVQGDSMTPTIRSGETILVDYSPQDIVDGIFMLSLHGRLIVKRLSIKDMHNISVISDNPRYNTFDVPIKKVCWASADPDADLRVVGKVVGRFEMGF